VTALPSQVWKELRNMAEHLSHLTELDQVLETGLDLLMQLTGFSVGWVSLREGDGFRLAAARNLPPGLEAGAMQFTPCRCQRLVLEGVLLEAEEVGECERLRRLREELEGLPLEAVEQQTGGLSSHVVVPLRAGVEVLGVVNLARPGAEPLDPERRKALTLAGEVLGVAVRRALLHAELHRTQLHLWQALLDLAQRLLGVASLEDLVEALRQGLPALTALGEAPVRVLIQVPGAQAPVGLEGRVLELPLGEAPGPSPNLGEVWEVLRAQEGSPKPFWRGQLGVFPFPTGRDRGSRPSGHPPGALVVALERSPKDPKTATWVWNLAAEIVAQAIERVLAQEKALYLAYHDPLTDLPNRRAFLERLEEHLLLAQREGWSLVVGLLDLDGFKQVNDRYGHAVGDWLLAQVARRLRSAVRASDGVARLGGDEFAFLLPHLDPVSAAVVAERLLAAVRRPHNPPGLERRLSVRASLGLALYPQDAQDPSGLLQAADLALYQAKVHGDRYALFGRELQENFKHQIWLEEELRKALQRPRSLGLTLHYQPRMDLETGRITALEALLRFQHPLGPLSPKEVIPLAERTGLIRPLTRFALERAARTARRLGLPVGVNLSPAYLHEELVEWLAGMLRRLEVPGELLEVEITESVLMEAVEQRSGLLEALRRLGLRVALDDFGTGYSSLAYLAHLPLDLLKIDRSFVRGLQPGTKEARVIEAVASLGRILGKRVVAEGVETQDELLAVRQAGCHEVQGFLISPPVPAEEALARWGPPRRS